MILLKHNLPFLEAISLLGWKKRNLFYLFTVEYYIWETLDKKLFSGYYFRSNFYVSNKITTALNCIERFLIIYIYIFVLKFIFFSKRKWNSNFTKGISYDSVKKHPAFSRGNLISLMKNINLIYLFTVEYYI